MFYLVPAFIVILILFFWKVLLETEKKRNEVRVRGIAKNIFAEMQDITDYILDGKYRLDPIDKDMNYAKVVYINGQKQVLVNLHNKYVVYNPNVETVLEAPLNCNPTCYLFKYQEEGKTSWNELYIIHVPCDSVRGVIED